MSAVPISDVRAVADAILYEGYILYPYRKSSLKNQQRWTFGGLFPRSYAERGGGDRWTMTCECLVRGDGKTRVALQLRFLQVVARRIARLAVPARTLDVNNLPPHAIVEAMEVGGRAYQAWDEALAREEDMAPVCLAAIAAQPLVRDFPRLAQTDIEPIAAEDGLIQGLVLRQSENVTARLTLSAQQVAPGAFRLRARVENITALEVLPGLKRDAAALFSTASTHLILHAEGGAFVSLTDPPEDLEQAAKACANDGCWPVLAGGDGATDVVLATPIILYDYPRIAPESQSDLFDGTEIDEILILRILTMTEAEKREMAAGDARARDLLTKLEGLSPDDLAKLHGTWRDSGRDAGRKPELVSLGHGALTVGGRVRLKPRKGGDIMDIALAGKLAVIEAIERDFEDRIHVAVVVEDDPGRDFGAGRFPGHRFFFSPEEIEPAAEAIA
jgi:hydrogenase maturation protease